VADITFSGRELDIMSILWVRGSGTVAEIRDELEDDIGYTSVLKVLQIMEEKGHVRHEAEGRRYRYIPVVPAEVAGRTAVRRVMDRIFRGSAELMLARMVMDVPITREQRDRMRRILDELETEDEA